MYAEAYVAGAAICNKGKEQPQQGKRSSEKRSEDCGHLSAGPLQADRKVGLGHGGGHATSEETECFAFLAGHESFAAAERPSVSARKSANKVRKKPLRVILNGLGKDAAQIISRINGFTYRCRTGSITIPVSWQSGKIHSIF